jgi:hypothetical protein
MHNSLKTTSESKSSFLPSLTREMTFEKKKLPKVAQDRATLWVLATF